MILTPITYEPIAQGSDTPIRKKNKFLIISKNENFAYDEISSVK